MLQTNETIDRPVRSVTTKFLLIDISRKKLDVTTTTFNVLFKLNWILDYESSILIAELWYLCRYCIMLCIIICLKTCDFQASSISTIIPKSQFRPVDRLLCIKRYNNGTSRVTSKWKPQSNDGRKSMGISSNFSRYLNYFCKLFWPSISQNLNALFPYLSCYKSLSKQYNWYNFSKINKFNCICLCFFD